MKLYDLVEGYYDPPEYPDTHDGFVNSELDDVTDLFNLVGYDPYRVRKGREPGYGCAIVEHKETKEKYVLHEDDIEEDLGVILAARVKGRSEDDEEDPEEEEEDIQLSNDPESGIQPKRPDERMCTQCFLLVRKGAPMCPVGDDTCPLFA